MILPAYKSRKWKKLMRYRRRTLKKRLGKKLAVSKNFRADEFYTHDGTPIPVLAIPGLKALCKDFLEPMRKRFGACTVLSGYRHRWYNTNVVHGVLNSQHIWDESPESVAADLRFAKGSPAEWAAYAGTLRKKGSRGGGIGRYDRSGFVHVDSRKYVADWLGN